MKILSRALLDELARQAAQSARGRAHHNIHASAADPVQRFLVVADPRSYFRPHRHRTRCELALVLRGGFDVITFEADGTVSGRHACRADGPELGFEVPHDTWHTLLARVEGSAFLEVKEGPYDPATASEFAPWAPPEGSAECASYLGRLASAAPGERLIGSLTD